jgi:hypothetical protein
MPGAFEATTILQLVLSLTWTCLFTTLANQKNPLFAQVIPSHLILEEIASATSLVFAPSLSRPSKLLHRLLSSTSRVCQRILPSAGLFTLSYSRNLVVDPKSISGVQQIAVMVSIFDSPNTNEVPSYPSMSKRLSTKDIR